MSYYEDALREIEKGRAGGFAGIPLPTLPRFSQYLGGHQAARMDLLGAESGVGKTAFADFAYIINPILSMDQGLTDFKLVIDYYSLEIAKNRKLVKLGGLFMYMLLGTVVDYKTLLSFGGKKNRLSHDMYTSFMATEEFLDRMEDIVVFHEGRTNPTKISINTARYRESVGKYMYRNIKEKSGVLLEKNPYPEDDNRRYDYERVYVPNDPKLVHWVVVDHLGKIQREHEEKGGRLLSKKDNIDRHSDYCVDGRNLYGTSYLNISQFNRGLADVQRQKFAELRPGREDFKDTGNTFEDSDLVIALFDPEIYNMPAYWGYRVRELQGRGRFMIILKNRDGDGNVDLSLRFIGECGHFCEIYTKSQIESDPTLYSEILNLANKTVKKFKKPI